MLVFVFSGIFLTFWIIMLFEHLALLIEYLKTTQVYRLHHVSIHWLACYVILVSIYNHKKAVLCFHMVAEL